MNLVNDIYYDETIFPFDVKQAIINTVTVKCQKKASENEIEAYKQLLLRIWKSDSMHKFINSINYRDYNKPLDNEVNYKYQSTDPTYDPKLIKDISIREIYNDNVRWSFYHILHKHKHSIQLFKDGDLWDLEDCEDPGELDDKIERIINAIGTDVISNEFKLKMFK